MKLIDMKIDGEAAKEATAAPAVGDGPRYPYGLLIQLDDEALEALGLKTLPKAGVTLQLMALVDVTAVSSREDQDGDESRSVSLQITDMSLEPAGKGADPADKLYEKG